MQLRVDKILILYLEDLAQITKTNIPLNNERNRWRVTD